MASFKKLSHDVINYALCPWLDFKDQSNLRSTCKYLHKHVLVTWQPFLDALTKNDYQTYAEEAARVGNFTLINVAIKKATKAQPYIRLFSDMQSDMQVGILKGALCADPCITYRILKIPLFDFWELRFFDIFGLCVVYNRFDVVTQYLKPNMESPFFWTRATLRRWIAEIIHSLLKKDKLGDWEKWEEAMKVFGNGMLIDEKETWVEVYEIMFDHYIKTYDDNDDVFSKVNAFFATHIEKCKGIKIDRCEIFKQVKSDIEYCKKKSRRFDIVAMGLIIGLILLTLWKFYL